MKDEPKVMKVNEAAEAKVMTVAEAAAALRLSRNATYAAIAAGELPSLRVGRRILVPRAALYRLLNGAAA